jgi:type IV secretory pathway TrbL component
MWCGTVDLVMIVRHWLNFLLPLLLLGWGMECGRRTAILQLFSISTSVSPSIALFLMILIIGGGGRHFIGVTLLGAGVTMAAMTV